MANYRGEANMSRIGELRPGSRCLKKRKRTTSRGRKGSCMDFANKGGPRKSNKRCISKSTGKKVNCTRQARARRAAKRRK
jgi:hypothetical protein